MVFSDLTPPPTNLPDPTQPSTYDLYAYPFMAWLKTHGIEMQTMVDELNSIDYFVEPRTNISQTFEAIDAAYSTTTETIGYVTATSINNGTHGGSSATFSEGSIRLRSSTTASSGVKVKTGESIFSLNSDNDAIFVATLNYETTTNTVMQVGLASSLSINSPSDASDGVYFRVSGTTVYAVCRNDTTESSTLIPVTLVQGTSYKFRIDIDGVSSATFKLYNSTTNELLSTIVVDTNLPNTTYTDVMGAGVAMWNTGTTALYLGSIAHIGLKTYSKTLKSFW
jgi:hypothetical protein